MNTQQTEKPWYRQFWPWFLIALPAASIIASMATIIIASNNPDSIVVDDYYKEGLAINRDIALHEKAKQLGVKAQIQFDATSNQVNLFLKGDQLGQYRKLTLQIFHPTLERHDRDIVLIEVADGHYLGNSENLEKGEWDIILTPENRDWKLVERVTVKGDIIELGI